MYKDVLVLNGSNAHEEFGVLAIMVRALAQVCSLGTVVALQLQSVEGPRWGLLKAQTEIWP